MQYDNDYFLADEPTVEELAELERQAEAEEERRWADLEQAMLHGLID